ncbi:CYTH domain-containing protein [Fundicoccus culcitae]|uniref:CYTH domain-containing protein n=1 Tax=Fundicoccus culcitae TaxID=2969821 RepID=A0ABY5P615_9LACT|nr:CYTH domain-containing protein [Fundicoccus culcitae]UUX34181.1 CYTH domain-containing protein [Fundicoccus culcitae]
MSRSIEKEIKIMLSHENFQKLINHFQFNDINPLKQTNTYYDTKDASLKQLQTALRLRVFKDSSEWTLKQTQANLTSLEITKMIASVQEAPTTLTPEFIGLEICAFLEEMSIDINRLKPTYEMTTYRWNQPVEYGLFAIDQTTYFDQTDYELELETDNLENGQKQIKILLNKLDIPYVAAAKKIARVSQYAQKVSESN